jgi:hypothetical protein
VAQTRQSVASKTTSFTNDLSAAPVKIVRRNDRGQNDLVWLWERPIPIHCMDISIQRLECSFRFLHTVCHQTSALSCKKSYDCSCESTSPAGAIFGTLIGCSEKNRVLSKRPTAGGGRLDENLSGQPTIDERKIGRAYPGNQLWRGRKSVKAYSDNQLEKGEIFIKKPSREG